MKSFIMILLASTLIYSQKSIDINDRSVVTINALSADVIVDVWNNKNVRLNLVKDINVDYRGRELVLTQNSYTDDAIRLTIPENISLKVNTSAGDILINSNINGNISCYTAGGDVKTNAVSGDALISTGGGDIHVGDVKGKCKISTGGGDISTQSIEGDLEVITGGGDIKIQKANREVSVSTSGGDIVLQNVNYGKVTTAGGNIKIGNLYGKTILQTYGGDVNVSKSSKEMIIKTSSGDIRMNDVNAPVKARTNFGDVHLTAGRSYQGHSVLESDQGSIFIKVPSQIKATVLTVFRNLNPNRISDFFKSDFKSGDPQKAKGRPGMEIETSINGGGSNKIEAVTSNGEVSIRKY